MGVAFISSNGTAHKINAEEIFFSVSLLLHFDGNFVDSSPSNLTVATNGATITNTQSKFGGSSAYFNGGTVSTLTTENLPEFGFGTGDFTIEMFVNQELGTRNSVISIGTYEDGILWRLSPGISDSLYVGASLLNGGAWDWDSTTSVPFDTWTHIALTRRGGILRAFINGDKVFEQSGVTVDLGTSRPLTIGCGAHELSSTDAYHGYIDDLRIVKGLAVYTEPFEPPTAPLPILDAQQPVVYPASLLLNFDENFNDSSVNNLSIMVGGDPPVQITTLEKKYGIGSADFLGASYLSLLVVEDSPALDLSGGEFTIETWFYARTLPDGIPPDAFSALISKDTYGSNFSWCIAVATGGVGVFTNNIAGDWNFTSLATITTGEWHHVAVCGTANSMNCFLDGVLIGSSSFGLSNASSSLTVGCLSWNNPGAFFDGYIDDLRVVKGLAVYAANFTPPNSPLSTNATPYGQNQYSFKLKYEPSYNYASLLLNFDGNFNDESINSFAVFTDGDASINTEIKKFGSGSASCNNGTISLTSGPQFAFENDFTIEGWFFFNENNVGYQPLVTAADNGDYTGWVIITESNNTLHFYGSTGLAWTEILSTSTVPNINEWTHIAVVRLNGSLSMYVNGILAGSSSSDGSIISGNSVKIGRYEYFPDYPRSFNGYIDGLRICKFSVYEAPFTPPTVPPSPIF